MNANITNNGTSEHDEGGILGRRDEDLHGAGTNVEEDLTDAGDGTDLAGSASDGGEPDDGMGADDPDDVGGEDEPIPGLDDESDAL